MVLDEGGMIKIINSLLQKGKIIRKDIRIIKRNTRKVC